MLFKLSPEEAQTIATDAGVTAATVRRWLHGSSVSDNFDSEFFEWPRSLQLRFIAMCIDGQFAGDRFPALDARRRCRDLLAAAAIAEDLGLIGADKSKNPE